MTKNKVERCMPVRHEKSRTEMDRAMWSSTLHDRRGQGKRTIIQAHNAE